MIKNNASKVAEVGEAQNFKLKPVSVEAIQYTGKNGKAVGDFAKERGSSVRVGGGWVKLYYGRTPMAMMKRGDILVWSGSELTVYTAEDFRKVHTVGAKNALLEA